MFQYAITVDKKIIQILGPHLYGDTASIIAELIANSHDAGANNCWVTLKTGDAPEIIIEDDGEGMTPNDVNKYFLDVGYDRRTDRPKNPKDEYVFGRKGIGKLAAFSLAKKIELYSLKDGEKAGCVLDYDKITKEGKDPEAIPDEDIKFEQSKLSEKGTGTRLVLKDIQRDIGNTYYYLVNRLLRNFNIDPKKFKIHLIKNDGKPRLVKYADLDFFGKMDTILTIGSEYKKRAEQVASNGIPKKYKRAFSYEGLPDSEKKKLPVNLPQSIEVVGKNGRKRTIDFGFGGWIGTIKDKGELRSLIVIDGASKEEEENISISDNRITIFSRKRIGEYDVLPKVQTDKVYDSYVIGEIHVDAFEDDELVDMAISNRRGYEEADSRYQALITSLKSLVRYIVSKRIEVQQARKDDEEKREADRIKKEFLSKSQTMRILDKKLDNQEKQVVVDDYRQFMRAAQLAQNTKKIMISSNDENKEYGLFIIRIFELLGLDRTKIFIFTSDPLTSVPHGQNIYNYLKECFRGDMYVIFLFSRDFYDSNMCISEAGAAWATNKNHSIIVIDVDFKDVERPIDNAKAGLVINDLKSLNKNEVLKLVKTVYVNINLPVPKDAKILQCIQDAVNEYKGKLKVDAFYPKRKFQSCPICVKDGNKMELTKGPGGLEFRCKCGNKIKADIR